MNILPLIDCYWFNQTTVTYGRLFKKPKNNISLKLGKLILKKKNGWKRGQKRGTHCNTAQRQWKSDIDSVDIAEQKVLSEWQSRCFDPTWPLHFDTFSLGKIDKIFGTFCSAGCSICRRWSIILLGDAEYHTLRQKLLTYSN